jgi:hypothetical protein
LTAGTHTVEIRFTNDYDEGPSCDRNLALDRVSLNSEATGGDAPDPLLFYDGFEREADDFRPPWGWVGLAQADRLTTSTTVARKGTHSAEFTVNDDDVYPLTPTGNPRAQLNSGRIFCEGDERWIGSSVYLPPDFPNLTDGGWLIVGSYGFAPPYEGGAPGSLVVRAPYDELMLTRDESYNRDEIWRTPLRKGKWMDFVFHVKFSRDPNVGFVELWVNGHRQTFSNGRDRLYYATLKKDSTGCGELILTSYRNKGMFEWATLYQDEAKVGTSYQAVAP